MGCVRSVRRVEGRVGRGGGVSVSVMLIGCGRFTGPRRYVKWVCGWVV